ncbi:MAG: hypothetical protein R3B06_17775 [Kofleriaceae bacterium]
MLRLTGLLVAVCLATACKDAKKSSPASGSSTTAAGATDPADGRADPEAMLKKLEAFRDEACACPEPTCVFDVERAMKNWLITEGPKLMGVKTTPAQDARGQAASAAMEACVERITKPTGQP